jgi:hypothetical protein
VDFVFRNGQQNKDLCDVTWGIIEYVGTHLLNVRNDREQIVYRYSDTQ